MKEQKELRVLVVQANGEELEVVEEEDYIDENEVKAIEIEKHDEPLIELSLNSVVRLTNLSTMKIKGVIQDKSMVVLIDCGTTHNFISD